MVSFSDFCDFEKKITQCQTSLRPNKLLTFGITGQVNRPRRFFQNWPLNQIRATDKGLGHPAVKLNEPAKISFGSITVFIHLVIEKCSSVKCKIRDLKEIINFPKIDFLSTFNPWSINGLLKGPFPIFAYFLTFSSIKVRYFEKLKKWQTYFFT